MCGLAETPSAHLSRSGSNLAQIEAVYRTGGNIRPSMQPSCYHAIKIASLLVWMDLCCPAETPAARHCLSASDLAPIERPSTAPVAISVPLCYHLATLLELGTLFTLVCGSKKLHKNFARFIQAILMRENAASRMLRACVCEYHQLVGLLPRPPRVLHVDVTLKHGSSTPDSD
jgi:hypothetical protein